MMSLKKGYKCPGCKIYHKFNMWAFAHMHEGFNHTCDNCGCVSDFKDDKMVGYTVPENVENSDG